MLQHYYYCYYCHYANLNNGYYSCNHYIQKSSKSTIRNRC